MAKKVATRRELLVRWRGIEEVIGDGGDDVLPDTPKRRRLQRLKEDWFSDAFNFLIDLPCEDHIWCGSWELMGPLLETFYNYSTDESNDSPLKLLWKRISVEMRKCTLCISQHHQAQDMYSMEYDSSSISPLLSVLRSLDEERVGQHLKEINARLAGGEYIPERDNAEVVSVMFEVLTFPCLFDDQSLVTEFQIFIETIDDKHELTLEGHQQYPGVYALFFFKRRVRTIGHRLAGYLGKLREATELEPLQPFLKKCIGLLETDVLPSTFETSRPRVQLERISVWLGIKALLGFLEPPALEEGILERYPIFFSIVLNHISDDSLEFSHAVVCLRLLFEMLGYKLWLRSTLSPTVMRNTLLSQCFHTQNEKSHKEIFDLFQPFLQSLETLQDGEHEQQRRHFIYFLIHQVNVSRNFSSLMRKKACQIALLIILRGYKMNPPSPPFECAHMWGPSLVSSLKDSSLENSLRRPAFDLIETLIVSDAAALVTSMLNCCKHPSIDQSMIIELDDEEDDDELPFVLDVEEKHSSSWSEYSEQSKITSQDCRRWRCIPMLWLDVLVEINPSVLPISVSKAVFWARSRFALVEPEKNAEMEVPVKNWLSFSAKEISSSFGWKVPTGSDDGGDGKESQNSMKVSTMCIPLIRTFKRLTAHYIVQMEQEELRKQWIWEPRMGESLILLLLEPNDNVRQVGKCLLEQVSNMRGLAHCLQFLCSCTLSMSATYNGLRHALRLVQVDSVLLNFETLHHFFFVLCKLLKEGVICTSDPQRHSSGIKNISKFSSQGGFLRQPAFDSFPENVNGHSSVDDSKSREKFSCLLSEITWPFIRKCLVEGKAFVDYKISQLTCARLLEILPVVFEKLQLSFHNLNGSSGMMVENVVDFKWLLDLMDWGKSRVPVIARYWRQTMISLLHLLKGSCSDKSASFIRAIENLISCDSLMMDELTEQVAHLSVSLSNEASCIVGKTDLKSKAFFSEDSSFERQHSASDLQPFASDDMDVQILDSVTVSNKMDNNSVIILSDDETEKQISSNKVILSDNELSHCMVHGKPVAPGADKEASQDDLARKSISEYDTSKQFLEAFQQRDDSDTSGLASQKQELDTTKDRQISASHPKPKSVDSRRKEINSKFKVKDSFPSQFKGNLVSTSDKTANLKIMDQALNRVALKTGETAIKESVRDIADDPWELAVKSLKPHQSCLTKPSASIPKRQVIQLQLPGENRSGYLRKLDAGVKRFKPPKLDDWYRPILEIDYFVTVGLASASKDESQTVNKLKEVPMCFESPDQYVDIFRPLVLEEFKAQLHSSFLEMSSSEGMCCGSASVLSVERIDDFHLVRCVHDGSDSAAYRTFSENDLVLLTRQPLQNSSHEVHMVGKVERREKDSKSRSNVLVIRFYLQNGSSRLNRARKLLIERSKWYLSRVMSITSQLREFHALSSINDIPILPMILKPFNGSLGRSESRKLDPSKLSQPLQRILESSYNSSQLQAISVAIASPDSKKNFDLSLIQGPPGTGKTRTIVTIVSGLLASPLKGVNMKNSLDGSVKQSSIVFTNSRPKMSQSAAVARAWQDAALARQLNEDVEQSLKPMGTSVRQRVLICAQSNAAVDELVSRISSEGLYSSDGNMYKPYLVRVGNVKTVHQNSLPFFIDTLVDQRLVGERMDLTDPKNDLSGDTSALRASLEKLVERIRLYEAKRANLRGKNSELKSSLDDETPRVDDIKETSDAEIEVKLRRLYEQKKEICRDLATAQAQERKANEESKALKHKLRKSILREAEIVVATLSGCGGDLYGVCSESISTHKFGRSSENHLFDAVVIDEAAQALEPATLIPLQLLKSSGTRCIMVGDPKQLPATVLSSVASKFRYQCSMFERLQRAGYPVTMLTKQYRMHPEICRFPSLHFYDSKLLNGENMSSKLAPFHETEGLGPYVFFDVVDGQESHGKNSGTFSLCNEHEADAAVEVLRLFRKRHPSEFVGGRIGIITPYKCQLSLLRSRFSSAFGSSITSDMEFNTVDGFQGREVDILVLSTVRAAGPCSAASGINSSSIGFVADVRRMNVALTRAKLSLWILGNARTLQTNCNWAALVKDAKERNLVISAKMPYQSMFKKALKNPISENSDYSSRQSRHGKTDITSKRAKQNEKNSKEVCERKENSVGSQSQINKRKAGDEHDLSARKEDVQSNKRRASEQCDFSAKKKFPSSVVAQRDSSTSKDVKSSTMGNSTDGDGRSKESRERQLHLRSTHLGKGKCTHEISQTNADRSEQEMGDGNKILKPQVLKGTSESLDHGGNQKSMEASTCSAGSILEEKDASDRRRALKEVDTAKDVISKRKQQREAVDALLSSALIPSKKSAASLKAAPAKRSLSPALNAGCDINLPKPRKAKQGQIRQHRDKKHRTGDEA